MKSEVLFSLDGRTAKVYSHKRHDVHLKSSELIELLQHSIPFSGDRVDPVRFIQWFLQSDLSHDLKYKEVKLKCFEILHDAFTLQGMGIIPPIPQHPN